MEKNSSYKYNLITVLGPTASGKTPFAARLAHLIESEIISADSRQVYREMDLGTGKDYQDYEVEGKKIPVHLIDIVDPGYDYNLFEYQRDFSKAFQAINNRKIIPILCGGSGLYIDAVLSGYNLVDAPINPALRELLEKKSLAELSRQLSHMKTLHNTTDSTNKKRVIRAIEIETYARNNEIHTNNIPEIRSLNIGIKNKRYIERKQITKRLEQRLKHGMVEEVEGLMKKMKPEELTFYGLEYKYITHYITGSLTYTEMFDQLNTAIHQFAKRQMTWFRKMERQGTFIHWIDAALPMDKKIRMANYILEEEL